MNKAGSKASKSGVRVLAFAILVLSARGLRAAPLERDLGLGLRYYRVHSLPGDLPAGGPEPRSPCVLDIRYAAGGDADARALLAWLKARAAPKTPVFLLANAETSPALLAPLDSADAVAGLVILGAAAPRARFDPDIVVRESPDAERRAYDALEKGASVESLTTRKVDTPRFDEETLVREHLSDSAAGPDEPDASGSAAPSAPPQLLDRALMRAVQLHRALLALRRL